MDNGVCSLHVKTVDQLAELSGAPMFGKRRGPAYVRKHHGHIHLVPASILVCKILAEITEPRV